MLRPLVCLLAMALIACEQTQNTSRSCYVCTPSPPHAQVCHAQLGRVEQKRNTYTCNLYFGERHLCESAEYCCEQAGLAMSEDGHCQTTANVEKEGQ